MQVQYSLLSQGRLQRDTKAACDDLGLKLIAYSPLALGMLTGRYTTSGDVSLPSGTPPPPSMFILESILRALAHGLLAVLSLRVRPTCRL